jgi:hypothetical protein
MEYLIKLKMAIIDADKKIENNYAVSEVDCIEFQNVTDECMKVIDRILDKEVV